jgi:hypothetical protein
MSLVTVTCAEPDFVGSTMLAAAIVTVALLGKSAGAVYKPVAEIVPTALFPPTTPLMLHVTAVLLAFVASAEKSCVFPSNTELDCGVTFTLMEGGGGGGGGPVTAPPSPQPSKLTPTAIRSATLQQWESPVKICRRGRTAWRKAVGGPRAFPPFPRGCESLGGNRQTFKVLIFYNIEVISPLDLAFVHSYADLEAPSKVLVRDSATRIQFQIGTTRLSFSLYFVRPFAHYFFNFF